MQARVLGYRGESESAEALAREAVTIVEQTDGSNMAGDAYCDLADVLAAAGRTRRPPRRSSRRSIAMDAKENLAMVAQVRPRLEGNRVPPFSKPT